MWSLGGIARCIGLDIGRGNDGVCARGRQKSDSYMKKDLDCYLSRLLFLIILLSVGPLPAVRCSMILHG